MATILNSPSLSPAPVVDYAALRQLDLERQALDHEKMFLETDAYITGLPQEQQAALNSYLEWAPDPESSKRKSVNRGYIGDFYGLPDEALGEGGYQTYRDRYAREVLGVPQGGELNDDSFFELMKEKQQKQKDFREIADYFTNDAAKSASVMKEADRFAETARIKKDTQAFPNMTKEDGDRLAEHWVDRRMAFEERFGPLRPQAREIYDMLAKGKLERFGEESQASIEGAIDRLTMLSPDDRAIVVAMLKNEGGTDTSGNTVEKVAGAAIRGFTGQLRGMMNSDEIGKILEYRQALEKGDVRLSAAMPTDPVELEKRFAEGLRGGDPTMFDTRVGISGQPRSERKATPEQIAKFKELTDAAIARSDTAAQAIGILEGTIDPIKTDKALNDGLLASTGTYAQRTAIDLGYSIGAMATIAIPYAGIIIAQGGYADQEYQKLREEGNDPETSYRASQFTGAMQAGFERTAFLFNFVPSSAVAQFTATRAGSKVMGVRPSLETSTAFQVLSKMGTIQAAQYGEEIAQASAPILTAFVGEKLGWNLAEQSKFQGEIQQFKEEGGFWRPEVFSTVMGLSVFGGGLSGISDSQQAQAGLAALLRDQTKIEAMGIAPAKAAEIVKTVGVEERKQAYIDAYAERDVQSPSAVAAQKLVTAQVDAQKAQGAAELLAMKNAGLDITRTADGWAVTDTTEPDAEPIPHATAEEAMTTVRSVIKARGMQREETFLDALSDYASIMEPGRTVRLSNKTGTLFEDLTEAIKEGRELSIESIWDRANQVRKKEGQAPLEQDINNPESAEALSGMFVLGRSFNEVQGNVVNKVSMIMRGGGTVDLVEEQAENDLSRSVASGRTTYDVVREVVKSLQKVTGDTYMFSDTTRGITEAWSTLVTLYTTGKARGNRITSGTRRELLAGLREARGDLPANYRAERQRLKAAEASGVAPSAFAKLRAYFDYLKSIMGHAAKIANAQADLEAFRDTLGQVARLKKAAKEGALGDLEALIRESVGLKEKDAFDSALADKVEDMMQPPDDGTGYSVKTLTKGEIARKEAAAAKAAAEKAAEELATATRIASVLNGVGQPTGPLVAANDVADAKQVPAMIPSKYVGKRFFLAMADLLGASGSVRGVPMQGGAGYPLMNYDPAEPTKTTAAWASTRDGVAALLRDMVKTNVIWKDEKDGKHYALLAPNAMDQETHKSNLNAGIVFVADMAHAVETGVINKEDNEKLLANIRSKNSTLAAFPGFTDPSALGFFGNLSFENRVVVFNAMQTAEALAAGAPVSNVMLLTTRDESYHGVELGSMLSMLLIDIDRMATQVDGKWVLRDDLSAADFNVPPHLSYDTIIPGRMIAHFRTPIPLDVAIPGMITEFKAASDAVNAEKIKKGEKPGTMGRPAFLLTRMPKGINGQLLTEELFADIESVQGLGKMGIHPPAIRALTDAVEGTWLTVNTKKAAGLKEFLKAQARSEARNTLKIYSEKELIELVKAGTVELYALGKEVAERDVAFAIHKMPDGTKELRSAINNTGVKGMLPLIVARAIEAGANRTEVFAVPTAANPNGVLVEAFEKHGWTAPKDKEGNRIVVPYDRNKLGTTEAERAHKEAALKDYWTSQGWDGQKMPDRVILSHGGIRTETIDDPTGLSLAERKTTGARSTPDETAAQIRGAVGDGIQENVPTGGSAGGTVAGRGRVLPRGTDTTVQTLESANLTPAQLRTLGLTSARFEALKATAAQGAGYSITTRQKASLKMQMTRDEILDAIDKSKDWKDFYTTYQYLLDEYFGDDATAFQSILSITSQAASVKANVANALRMYGYWKRGEEFDGKKRGEAESGALSGVLKNLERWRDDVALSGRKISNYQAANEGKEGATEKVVVDRHIANMLFGTKTPTDAQFTEAEKVLTEIAQSIGWEPRQVQAALWAASIRKSGTEPASYDQYLKTLRERGTIYERTGATPGGGGIFAAGVERPIRRPVTRRGAGKTGTDGYSISTRGGAGDGSGRGETRATAPLEGAPSVPGINGPDPRLVTVAEDYARSIGIQLRRQSEYARVDPERAKRIADAYEAMPHTPEDPVVKEAYASLIKQTVAQYNALAGAGYKFWFIDPSIPENIAYVKSPWNAMRDVRNNQQMGVFPTSDGFGSGDLDVTNNPMLAETGIEWPRGGLDGKMAKVLANDLFRAVHDAFGHGLEGAGFRAQGEENAWQAHVRLFTGSAVAAITSETRGQNSWLNYGPNAEQNRTAKTEDTVFAEQKTGLMPLWTWTEGKVGDMPEEVTAEDGYSIASSSRLERIMARLDEIAIDPEVRFDMMQRASAALAKMARDIEFRDDIAGALNSDEEAKFQAQQANAMAQLIDRYSAEEQRRQRDNEEDMQALKAEHEAALQDLSVKADIEAGGAQEDGWTTDQKDALKVRQRLEQTTLQARQRAEKLALETKQRREDDAAKANEAKEVALLKTKQGTERKTRANSATEQTKRQDMLDALSTLDAILTPFPAEVRAKVGGFVSLAKLRTNEAMEAYLKDRVEKLNNAVETYLRKDYAEQIKDLIKKGDAKRASGKKPGGKLGAEGHALFDAVKAAAGMSEEETNKAIMDLSDAIEKARSDNPDAVPALAEKLQAAVMFGDLNGKTRTARDLANALKWLKENYERERTKWRMQEEARLAEINRLADGGVVSLDGSTTASDRLNSTSELGEFRAGSSGFSGAMRALFGKDSELFKRWTAASRRAIIKRTTEFQALQKDWRDLKDRLYGKGWKGDRKLYDDIVEPVEKSGVLITDKMKKSREVIPVSVAENILAGKAPEIAERYTDAEKAEMRVALDANILEKRPKDTISLTKISGSTVGSEIMLSQGQAMHISLMWRQKQGRAPMEAHGYTEETIEQVEAFMSPEAKAIRDWIASRYTDEWGDLNAVFAGMFGVNLPQIENYSPLTFWSQQRKELANPDPSGGPIMAQGGMSTGMLKERVEKHGAEPRIVNAVDVFFDHMRQVAHFKAFAELAREMRGVMSKPEIRRSLAVKHGKIGTELMDKWMDAMEQGGLTQKPGWFESQLSNMGGARAVAVLAWNFKSAFTNVLNLLGMARKMPPDQYLKGLGRLFSGRLNWWVGKGSVFQSSEIIQRRINSGMSPEMQAGMSRIANMRPSMLKAFMEGGMALHAYSDAIFTSGSVAIAYDFHLREFMKDKTIGLEEAQRMALAATEQSIADVTQPTEFLDKSTVEMERNAMARAIFSFQSDPRQKMALQMEAYSEKDWGRLIKLVIVDHVVTGLIMQTITNAWRDANDDDDGDDVFDPLHWQWKDYMIAMAIGPWSALPMFGPAIDAVGAAFKTGPAINESILTSAGSWAGRGVRMATSEKGKIEPYEMTSDVIKGTAIGTAIMTGDARFAVVARVGSTAFDLLDNYIETADESAAHELKMRRLKDKELNPPVEKTDEEKAQAKVEKAAKDLRELERLREEQKGK
jgi:hypothetical protein